MPRKKSYLKVKDQFCGAGGSSQAVRNVSRRMGGGIEVEYALNHWPLAVESHSANFPNTKHDCIDMSSCSPHRYQSTDILITSPSCTAQGYASGKKKPEKQLDIFEPSIEDEAAERSRMTMWDVPRFAEYHNYNYIIVENVWQAITWIQWDNWLRSMHTLGYRHKLIFFNSRFAYPCPQSRDRLYIHFWKKGNTAPDLNFYPKAHCQKCGKDVDAVQSWKSPHKKYGVYGEKGQYNYRCPVDGSIVEPYYYAALNAIDFTDIGKRIGDRKKQLSPNTMRRILKGKEKLDKTPFFVQAEHSNNLQNIRSLFGYFPTQTTRQTIGLVFPSIIESATRHSSGIINSDKYKSFISYYYGGADMASSMIDPHFTMTTVQGSALISPLSDDVNDWYFRMINYQEGKRIMSFDEDYIILGDSRKQFIQLGNAVTPPAMEWQLERAISTFN
jgi:DNA (cytosine-5)-methyltransferase 1